MFLLNKIIILFYFAPLLLLVWQYDESLWELREKEVLMEVMEVLGVMDRDDWGDGDDGGVGGDGDEDAEYEVERSWL